MEAKVYLLRTPLTEPALSVVFGYKAKAYDLDAYSRVNPTFPERLLNMFLLELTRAAQRTPLTDSLLAAHGIV
jgi:hypothetical protein